jgi:hypothetical protein
MANSVRGEMNKEGTLLTLYIDVSKEARANSEMSSSNKTRVLATTSGFTRFGDVSVSVNATIARRSDDPAIITKAK